MVCVFPYVSLCVCLCISVYVCVAARVGVHVSMYVNVPLRAMCMNGTYLLSRRQSYHHTQDVRFSLIRSHTIPSRTFSLGNSGFES